MMPPRSLMGRYVEPDIESKIMLYLIGIAIIVVGLSVINWIIGTTSVNTTDKISSYECGFDTLGDARIKFDLFFYLISLMFLIFDLELILLFPLIRAFAHSADNLYLLILVGIFCLIISLGYIYEWHTGAIKY